MFCLEAVQKAIREEALAGEGGPDGWLFCNFRHRDALSDAILERPASLTNSRLWLFAVPARGEPLGFLQATEAGHLDGLPGRKAVYTSRAELLALLAPLAGRRWGAHFSENLPAVSFLDAGTALFLQKAGLELLPAEALIQRFCGLLDEAGLASHLRASAGVYGTARAAWDFVRAAFASGKKLFEGDIRRQMEEEFARRGLTRDHPPLAAAGRNTADPHYDFAGAGARVREGELVQLDLWAKEAAPAAVYADISLVGVYARNAPADARRLFSALAAVRDETFAFIARELAARAGGGAGLRGAEVDAFARSRARAAGFEAALKHRTGHGIDSECHGRGVNLDSVEFPDNRLLLEGSCFSIEPGFYFPDRGMRTEIDVFIKGGAPHFYGEAQTMPLCCG